MSRDNETSVNYVKIGFTDGSARILKDEKAQKFFEEMIASFYRDFRLGVELVDHEWEQIGPNEEG